jgi:hypothetical protein
MISFKIKKNSQNLYRVEIGGNSITHYMRDEDLLLSIPSSFKSSVLHFTSKGQAEKAIKDYEALRLYIWSLNKGTSKIEIEVLDDFEDA